MALVAVAVLAGSRNNLQGSGWEQLATPRDSPGFANCWNELHFAAVLRMEDNFLVDVDVD
eukprot:CAMPEP_0181327208 /NCGR_PEP_ID=MMETSP1101-20121128/21963_1 /TAXON_ID=46948 /ORGANISM="Rhodomonas abbreviata, Strain Caron Lab Isolate" /LENGTH=59 /DNA_ID=CAMNT_0023435821 /DNA_START=77 /DNA_END=256 /DNA_ORIENTATION=+